MAKQRMEEINVTVSKGLRNRRLTFNEDFIRYEVNPYALDKFSTFTKQEITEYRFGVNWIKLHLTFGREYFFILRNSSNQTLKINYRSFFGIKKKAGNELFETINDALWNFYFSDITNGYLKKYDEGEEFKIGNVTFSVDGITLNKDTVFKKDIFIAWDKIRTKSYNSYFAIYADDDASNTNKGYYYKDDWNTNVLHSTLRTILRSKNIESYK